MLPEELRDLAKRLRRTPLFAEGTGQAVSYDRLALHDLVPHRDPFLLIDGIDRVDLAARTIRGVRHVRPDDPVFVGHFPGTPVYPGVLQVEAMGQLGLCLTRLAAAAEGDAGSAPPAVRATHIHHATYLAPVLPGDDLVLHAGIIEHDGLTAVSAGQIYKGATLCACAIQEVCFVD